MPIINDSTVVASSYTTSANARPQMLKNGWIVTANVNGTTDVRLQVSKDNGATFIPLCFITGAYTQIALASLGNMVYLIGNSPSLAPLMWKIDVTTVTNINIASTWVQVCAGENSYGSGISLIINPSGTELHACWSSKNSTYSGSFNIRYAKGIISAVDGSVTWGTTEQCSIANASGTDYLNPSITLSAIGVPTILVQWNMNTSAYAIGALSKTNIGSALSSNIGGGWYASLAYSPGAYSQASPSAIFVPQSINGLANGRIWVAWHGIDSTDTTKQNIRVSYSDNGGTTWSAMTKVTSGNVNINLYPTLTANNNGDIYVLFQGSMSTKSDFYDIRQAVYSGSSWSAPVSIESFASSQQYAPSSLYDINVDLLKPLYIWQNNGGAKVMFSGTWTITTISVTEGSIGTKSDKTNLLTYVITTDGTMSAITEKVNGVTTYTVNGAVSGQSNVSFVTQAQWDSIKYGKYKDATGGLNTLTISMGTKIWTYTFDKRLATNDDITSAMKAVQDSQATMLASIKSKLVTKVGGLTSDTFDSIINGITAKKCASGILSPTFTITNSYNAEFKSNLINVTGLSFTPSIIIVKYKNNIYPANPCTVVGIKSKLASVGGGYNSTSVTGTSLLNSTTQGDNTGVITYTVNGFTCGLVVYSATAGSQTDSNSVEWIAFE